MTRSLAKAGILVCAWLSKAAVLFAVLAALGCIVAVVEHHDAQIAVYNGMTALALVAVRSGLQWALRWLAGYVYPHLVVEAALAYADGVYDALAETDHESTR